MGSDINVLPVWADYRGKGTAVAIVDDGVQLDHPDLAANVDKEASWDAVDDTPGELEVRPFWGLEEAGYGTRLGKWFQHFRL